MDKCDLCDRKSGVTVFIERGQGVGAPTTEAYLWLCTYVGYGDRGLRSCASMRFKHNPRWGLANWRPPLRSF